MIVVTPENFPGAVLVPPPFFSRTRRDEINYYRRFPADYANDTRHLNFTEHGVYNLLLDWAYSSERPLPKSKEKIYRKLCARDDSDRAAIDTILGEFFKLTRYGYSHARVSREIKRSNELRAIHSISGKKGIEIRLAKAKQSSSPGLASQTLDSRLYKLEPEESKPTPSAKPALFVLPEWISMRTWNDFEEMRKKIRRPLTDRARNGIIAKLNRLQGAGNDPEQVLEQSIIGSWSGVYELRGREGVNGNGRGKPVTAQDHINRSIRDAEILGLVSSRKPS